MGKSKEEGKFKMGAVRQCPHCSKGQVELVKVSLGLLMGSCTKCKRTYGMRK